MVQIVQRMPSQIKRDAATRHEPESTTVDTFFWDDDDFDSELDFNSASYEKELQQQNLFLKCVVNR